MAKECRLIIIRPDRRTREDGYLLYDATKNGEPFLTGLPYLDSVERILAVIDDDDTYQEIGRDGFAARIYTGKELKEEDRHIRNRFQQP
jgi:hypothetical protein